MKINLRLGLNLALNHAGGGSEDDAPTLLGPAPTLLKYCIIFFI